ncbi:MAG: amidohydrolase family protein [Firmicutes bacterium]|nr:amidohydrolase family protein [Bacillota bacterium]
MEIRGVRVWDGEHDLGPSDVRFGPGGIEAVTAAEHDLHPGLSLLPGLVDAHVHMVNYAGRGAAPPAWDLVTPWPEQLLHGAGQARRALRAGVTTVRDLGAFEPPVALRRTFDLGALPGPRVLAYGHVGMTAGHGDLMWPSAVRRRPPTADGPDACRRLVRTYGRMGVDGIKIFTSGGVMSHGDRVEWRNHTAEELAAIVDEAHALGLPVAAHAHTPAGIRAALEAGVDTLEHATAITSDLARMAADRGAAVVPTLVALARIAAGRTDAPPENVAKARALVAARGDALRLAADSGVRLVMGTDGGDDTLPFGSQYDEMRAMAEELGLGPEDALRAATSGAAQALGLGDRLGRVRPGFEADLLLVRGEPWRDLTRFGPERLAAVVVRGEVVVGAWPDDGAGAGAPAPR